MSLSIRLSGGETKKKIDTGSLLIVVVILVAVGGLFSMRTLARIAMPAPLDPEKEKLLNEYDPSKISSIESGVWNDLKSDFTLSHVPLDGVSRNPFIIWEPEEPVAIDTRDPLADNQKIWEQKREERQKFLEAQSKRFVLQMVLLGARPLANMNDQIVRVGETIKLDENSPEFRVAAIRADSVKLVTEDESYELVFEATIVLLRDR